MSFLLHTIRPARITAALPRVLARGWTWLRAGANRRRQRLALADLDEHLLRDIGLSPEDAAAESRKPFWTP